MELTWGFAAAGSDPGLQPEPTEGAPVGLGRLDDVAGGRARPQVGPLQDLHGVPERSVVVRHGQRVLAYRPDPGGPELDEHRRAPAFDRPGHPLDGCVI